MDLENRKIAVLIDAENTSHEKIDLILQEISLYGHIITKRAYGNWKNCSNDWIEVIKNNAITPIQQFNNTKGKNSSDIALVIDAMDLLFSKKYDTFVIVSSDSDFTRLATRIHDEELIVIGVGEIKTPQSLIKACDNFIFTENLEAEQDDAHEKESEKSQKAAVPQKREFSTIEKRRIVSQLKKIAANEKYADEDGWVNIGTAGSLLKRQDPGFDTRTFGFPSLVKLLETLDKSIELRRRNNSSGQPIIIEYKPKKIGLF